MGGVLLGYLPQPAPGLATTSTFHERQPPNLPHWMPLCLETGVTSTTLRYRLRRAEEVLGGSLTDPALLARLYLAFGAG